MVVREGTYGVGIGIPAHRNKLQRFARPEHLLIISHKPWRHWNPSVGQGALFALFAAEVSLPLLFSHALTVFCSVGLPSINHLDPDRIKREEIDHQRNHSAAAMASPLHPFAPPPHLHSNHQLPPASSASASLAGLLSPSDMQRPSGNDKDPQRHTARQSLPSIHEALGAEPPRSYPSIVPPPPAVSSGPKHYPSSSATTSPSDQRARHFSSDFNSVPSSASSFSHPRSPFLSSSASQAPPPPSHQTIAEPPRPSFATSPHNSNLPALHPLKTTQSPPTSTTRPNNPYSSYPQPPTTHDTKTPQSATSMNHHYPYPHYSPGYPLSAPSTNSAYPPSTSTYSAPPRYPPPSWRDGSEMVAPEEKKINRSSLAPYGESVKRHLESFDLEASLNEVCIVYVNEVESQLTGVDG